MLEGEQEEQLEEGMEEIEMVENFEENGQNEEVENMHKEGEELEITDQPVQIKTSKNIIKEVPKSEESSEHDRQRRT